MWGHLHDQLSWQMQEDENLWEEGCDEQPVTIALPLPAATTTLPLKKQS